MNLRTLPQVGYIHIQYLSIHHGAEVSSPLQHFSTVYPTIPQDHPLPGTAREIYIACLLKGQTQSLTHWGDDSTVGP
jgi:hypothetical protein